MLAACCGDEAQVPIAGRPRGFGFVVFEDPAIADKVVSIQHTIDRREVSISSSLAL